MIFFVKSKLGLMKGNWTTDHMFILENLIDRHTSKGASALYACFVDFRRAFDSVWHDSLFYKLRRLGVSEKFNHTIKSMYASTILSAKVGDYCTDT